MEVLGLIYALLLGTLASAEDSCVTRVINDEVEDIFETNNNYLRSIGSTSFVTQPWIFQHEGNKIRTSEIMRLGVDSLGTIGNSTLTVCRTSSGELKLYIRYSFGFGFFNLIIPTLQYNSQTMSASLRVWKNEFTQEVEVDVDGDSCRPRVVSFEMTRADSAILWSSLPAWDGTDVSDVYTRSVIPLLNSYYAYRVNHQDQREHVVNCTHDLGRRKKRSLTPDDAFQDEEIRFLAKSGIDTAFELFEYEQEPELTVI